MDIDFGFLDFLENTTEFFQYILNWLYQGIYDFTKEIMVWLTKAAMLAYLKATLFALDIAYEVVQDIFVDLGLAARVESAWMQVPANMRDTLSFFGVPQALVIIASAIPTRIALKFVPFIGR